MTEVESVIEPNGILDDFCWESVAFICVHPPILSISASLHVSTSFFLQFLEAHANQQFSGRASACSQILASKR